MKFFGVVQHLIFPSVLWILLTLFYPLLLDRIVGLNALNALLAL